MNIMVRSQIKEGGREGWGGEGRSGHLLEQCPPFRPNVGKIRGAFKIFVRRKQCTGTFLLQSTPSSPERRELGLDFGERGVM